MLSPVLLVPEVRLYQVDDIVSLWNENVDLPYWAIPWVGGQALARYLLDYPNTVAGRTVLDLGAASGLCGIAAARAGAGRVVAADIDRLAAHAVQRNAVANGFTLEVVTADLLEGGVPDVDVVLLGDMFYERNLADRLVSWLLQVDPRTLVLVGDPGRDYVPKRNLRRLATYDVPAVAGVEGRDRVTTTVYELRDDGS